jgi:hypothetical protein
LPKIVIDSKAYFPADHFGRNARRDTSSWLQSDQCAHGFFLFCIKPTGCGLGCSELWHSRGEW